MFRGNRAWCGSLVLVLAACTRLGPPADDGVLRVDGRSAEAFERSMRRIKNSLSDTEQSRLCDSALRLHGPVAQRVLRSSGGDVAALQRALREQLHGMSVAEIHAAAARVPLPK
jgi:hypothetical protein